MFVDRISLRLRLAVIFALGSLAALALVTGALYWAFRNEIRARNRLILDTELQEIVDRLARRPWNRKMLEEEGLLLSEAAPAPLLWFRILGEGGPVLETPGMEANLPEPWFERQTGRRARRGQRSYMVDAASVGSLRIQGALDVTADEKLIDSYWRRWLYAMFLGASGCAVLGWWAAQQGLRPLRSIADTARNIHIHRLRDRLESRQVPPELRDLVESLNAMLDRLNQAFERLGRFSSDLAHEFRTPITNLMGETEVVLSRERAGEAYRQVLESSLEEYRRLSRLVNRMLFLARAEDPGTAIEASPIEAEGLVMAVTGYFEAVAEEQGIHLEGRGSGRFRGDPDLLHQALSNLVSNALEATPRDGRVDIRATASDIQVELEVRDTGRGIPSEDLPRILDRFYRTRDSLDRKASGMGLGLAIVQSIAHLHGGRLLIASEPGRGTSARIWIPKA